MRTRFFRSLLSCLPALLALAAGPSGATVVNQASVSYADPVRGTATQQSNTVHALSPVTIEYFTGADFRTLARVTSAGRALYVQAGAAACNSNPARIESVLITLRSTKTGDSESYSATETAPDSGVFRIDAGVTTATPAARSMRAGDKELDVVDNDTLNAMVNNCGDGEAMASILIDPSGVVFDSRSNAAVAGATVTLIDVTGEGNGGQPGGPARVLAMDAVSAWPSTVITDADGRYQFPLVAPSLYRLKVTAPRNYTFPSKAAPGALPAGRDLHLYGSFGGSFIVSLATGAVAIDVPLDAAPGTLYIEKNASRATADIADFVDYSIRVHNTGDVPLAGVAVEDQLPAGFSLEPGSVRLDRAAAPDPAGSRGPALRFALGTLDANATAMLSYRVRIGPGALQGDGTNRARATSVEPPLTSSMAAARVKVEAGIFSSKGHILGTVFADCNGDGLRSADEPGVPGVRIYLEDGSYAQTDEDGRYSFAEVRPRTHVAKLDRATLPAGALPALLDQRQAGDAGSRFVDLHDGELAKADFALAGCAAALRDTLAARKAALQQEQKAQAAAPAAPLPAATASLDTLDNSLGFIDLADGAVTGGTQATVRVKGGEGVTFTLRVNGEAVSDDHVGKRSSLAERRMESWDYVGVPLQAGRNVLEVEQHDTFGNPRGSRRITVVAPGPLARLRLELPKAGYPADGRSLALVRVLLEDAQGVPVTARTALTLDASAGDWQQADPDPREAGLQAFAEGGAIEVALRAPAVPGEAQLAVRSGAVQAASSIAFLPELRPLVAAGLIDGALSLGRSSGNTAHPVRNFDGFEDSLRQLSGSTGGAPLQAAGRAAMFMKGKVGSETLLTMSYDSGKEKEALLFRDLNPLSYYPAYGDNAQRGFDAQSTGRLYARADRRKSWLMIGDFTPPGVTPARNLGAYNRNLNGLRGHYEEGALSVDAFASHDSTRQMVTELSANGTSGPYLTGSGNMVINSERVELLVRDRNQPGVILSTRAQARYSDYDVEPLTGRILFRAPVPSLDADLNPVSIRISYEVDQGSPTFWVGGAAVQYKAAPWLEVGGSYVDDRNPIAAAKLSSVNATVRPDDKTTVIAEAAQMDKPDASGRAARIDATRSDGKLEAHVFAGRADAEFTNLSSNLTRGRMEAGARATYAATEQVKLFGEALHTEDLLTGAARDGVQLGAGYAFTNGVRVEAGLRHAREQAAAGTVLAQPELSSVRAKVAAQVPGLPQASVYAEAEQDVKDSGRRMAAIGGDYRFANGSRVYGRHELISSLGSNYALNEGVQRNATVFGVDSDYMKDGRVFSEYRARGSDLASRQAEAAVGLRNLWTVAEGVRASTSFERVRVLSGSAANASAAVTGAIEITRDPRWKGTARLELRKGQDSDGLLSTLGLAYKLSDSWAFLGKNTLSATRSKAGGTRLNELLQSGLAYRALETLGWNGLAKYEYKREKDDGLANMERTVHAVSVTANWQPQRATVLTGRYAAKLAQERTAGLESRAAAQLASARVMHELSRDWNVGASVQVLAGREQHSRQFAAGLEAGYQVQRNMWVSAGYNLMGFRERDLAGADATAKGAYVRLRMKFDERTLDKLMSSAFN